MVSAIVGAPAMSYQLNDGYCEVMMTDIRIACHQLAEPEFGHPANLVGWMGAMQAQDYTMSKWAVGLRLKSATIAQVDEALAKGEIVRTHIMRPTWHYVAGKDLRWMLQLTSSRLRKVIDSWVKASGLDISENQYTRCNDLTGNMLSVGNSLSREEIEIPATLKDFVWWSGLTVTEAKQAIGSIIPEKHHPKAFNRWGTFYPVILYNGQIIGNWSKVKKKEGLTVTASFFDKRSKCPLKLLQEVEKQYRKFVDGYVTD